tara:strand:+ start:323 stop:532 length:210 start_codon:yes stop_codon:yes gene_type:complete
LLLKSPANEQRAFRRGPFKTGIDILGLTEQPPKFSKNFLLETADIPSALAKYVADVKNGVFPTDAQGFS